MHACACARRAPPALPSCAPAEPSILRSSVPRPPASSRRRRHAAARRGPALPDPLRCPPRPLIPPAQPAQPVPPRVMDSAATRHVQPGWFRRDGITHHRSRRRRDDDDSPRSPLNLAQHDRHRQPDTSNRCRVCPPLLRAYEHAPRLAGRSPAPAACVPPPAACVRDDGREPQPSLWRSFRAGTGQGTSARGLVSGSVVLQSWHGRRSA